MTETTEDRDLTQSIGCLLTEPGGAMLIDLVTTDYESFWSVLTPLPDIADTTENAASVEAYKEEAWLTDMHRAPDGALYACDGEGNVHTNVSGSWQIEPVSPGKGLRVIRCLADGAVLAAGTAGIVYSRQPAGWVAISGPLGQWITGMDGSSGSSLAVCGDAGLVATFDGAGWTVVDLPSNATFHSVLALPGGYLVGGASGALYRSTADGWEDLGGSGFDIHGLARRETEIWAACGSAGVALMEPDGTLNIVKSSFAAFCIHASGRYLALAGNLTAVRFDGADWKGRRYG